MDLSQNIEKLLFNNDCVIIPTIGGFIAHYSPASIDLIEQQVFPPKKTISFNSKLVNNDGLLANQIALEENLSYEKASEKVNIYSQEIESDLFNNKIVHFSNIGKLYFNSDSKLEFVPENTNFLRDAYGLPDLDCTPVLRNREILKRTLKEEKVLKTQKLVVAQKNKIPLPKLAAAAILLILAFSSPYIYKSFISGTQSNTPIAKLENTTDSNKTSTASLLPNSTITEGNTSNELEAEKEELAEELIEEKQTTEVIEETHVAKESEEEAIDKTKEHVEKFVIVLGAFGKRKNADRLAKKLAKDNYLPDITLKNGLNRVGVQITCSPEEVKTHLKFLKDNYNKKAWLVE